MKIELIDGMLQTVNTLAYQGQSVLISLDLLIEVKAVLNLSDLIMITSPEN